MVPPGSVLLERVRIDGNLAIAELNPAFINPLEVGLEFQHR